MFIKHPWRACARRTTLIFESGGGGLIPVHTRIFLRVYECWPDSYIGRYVFFVFFFFVFFFMKSPFYFFAV